jgi:hypothetical protein
VHELLPPFDARSLEHDGVRLLCGELMSKSSWWRLQRVAWLAAAQALLREQGVSWAKLRTAGWE